MAAVAGVAYATAGSGTKVGTTVIRACRSKSSGLLRVVTATARCRTDETLLTWNVQGPAGPSGPLGPKGDTGAAGAPGAAGAGGPQGRSGPAGPAGPAGAQGAAGAPGQDGAPGVSVYAVQPANHCATRGFDIYQDNALMGALCDGAAGAAGPAGAQGAAGATGPAGPAGAQGASGSAGPAGPAGATGAQGAKGDPGPAGADGAPGLPGATGPAGPQGPIGPLGPQGLPGNDGAAGKDGTSIYAVTSSFCSTGGFDVYETGGASDTLLGSICAGAPGAAGAAGPQGPQGTAGAQGDPGPQGPQGATGPAGPAGPAGPQGDAGPQGPQGATGPQGPKGDPGPGVQVTALGTASVGAGQTASLLALPNLVTVNVSDCYVTADGSYASDLSFTNTGSADLWATGGLLAAGTTSGSPLNLSISDNDATTHQPDHAQREFVDWDTRGTIAIYIAGETHSGSSSDNSLACTVKAFAVVTSP